MLLKSPSIYQEIKILIPNAPVATRRHWEQKLTKALQDCGCQTAADCNRRHNCRTRLVFAGHLELCGLWIFLPSHRRRGYWEHFGPNCQSHSSAIDNLANSLADHPIRKRLAMSCLVVTTVILQQVWQYILGFHTYLVSKCRSITEFISQLQQKWQTVCSQWTTSIQKWELQEETKCDQTSSQVCGSLPWPLNNLCKVVASVVCNIITVLVLVFVTIVQVICSLVLF